MFQWLKKVHLSLMNTLNLSQLPAITNISIREIIALNCPSDKNYWKSFDDLVGKSPLHFKNLKKILPLKNISTRPFRLACRKG